MWRTIELIVVLAIILVSITEFFLPILLNKPLFGSFRKLNAKEKKQIINKESLDEKIAVAKDKVEEVKKTQNEITEHFKSAEQLKDESDNLLK